MTTSAANGPITITRAQAQDVLRAAVSTTTAARTAHAQATRRLASARAQLAAHEEASTAAAEARRTAALTSSHSHARGRCCSCGGRDTKSDWRAAAAAAAEERGRAEALRGLVRAAEEEERERAAELRAAEGELARACALLRVVDAPSWQTAVVVGSVVGSVVGREEGPEEEEVVTMAMAVAMTTVDDDHGGCGSCDAGAAAASVVPAPRKWQGQKGGEESEEDGSDRQQRWCQQQQQQQRWSGDLVHTDSRLGEGFPGEQTNVKNGPLPAPVPVSGENGLHGWGNGRAVLNGDRCHARQEIRDDFVRQVQKRAELSRSVDEANPWWETEDGTEDWTEDEIFVPHLLSHKMARERRGRTESRQSS
ncbi:hypothetical protein VTH82DRAFT_8437 [Thermothelomyces myriococcoides]